MYVHFVHSLSPATMKEVEFYFQYYYQGWKRNARAFDLEGYMHQEVPRLMLLPVIVPDAKAEPSALKGLLDALRSAFLLPSLYLDEGTFSLAGDKALLAKTEKVYYGPGKSRALGDIVCHLNHQGILDHLGAQLAADSMSMTGPCPASLIVMAQDGKAYTCPRALRDNETLTDLYGEMDGDNLVADYDERRSLMRDCLRCKGMVLASFADLPLPQATANEVGALLYHFGKLYQDLEDHVQAIGCHKKSLDLSPVEEAGSIYFRLGLSYTKTGQYDEAVEAFNKAESTYQDAYFFHFYAGICHFERGDYGMALARFSRALSLNPQHDDLVRILIYAGSCHNSLGEYEDACVHLERAKETAGHVKEIYNALGFAYFKLKDYDKAIENLSRAVEMDPDSAIDYASLGSNYREKGDTNKAIAMYEKALALDPSLTFAREGLQKLKAQGIG
jgi:tetratricopeptide (TPR) repeat protein